MSQRICFAFCLQNNEVYLFSVWYQIVELRNEKEKKSMRTLSVQIHVTQKAIIFIAEKQS